MYDQKILVSGRGNIGKKNFRDTPNSHVLDLFVLSGRSVKNSSGGYDEHTDKNNVVVWGNYAQTLNNHLNVGDTINFHGYLEDENWTDNDGTNRTAKKIRATHIEITRKKDSSNGSNGNAHSQPAATNAAPGYAEPDDQDVPF